MTSRLAAKLNPELPPWVHTLPFAAQVSVYSSAALPDPAANALERNHAQILEAVKRLLGRYTMLAAGAARQRDATGLQQFAPLAEDPAVRRGSTPYQDIIHSAWGVAHRPSGESDLAETRLNRALTLFVSREAPWQFGWTWSKLGEVARAEPDGEATSDRYRQAINAFQQVDANPDMQQTRAALAGQDCGNFPAHS